MNTPTQRHAEIDPLMRLPAVMAAAGLKRTAIWTRIKAGTFPKPVHIGTRIVAWPQSAIAGWINDQVKAGSR